MADQQRRVSLIFDVNTQNAEARLKSLSNSLQAVINAGTRSSGIKSIDKELQTAAQAAAQLGAQLNNALNTKTGKLDLSKFNDSLKSGGISLEQYRNNLVSLGVEGERSFVNLARAISTAEAPLRKNSTLLNEFATSIKNTIQWQISSSLIHGFIGSIQSAMSYAQSLNKNLTDIRIVTGQTADEMARFAEQANKSAKELSTTTNQYAQASLIFYQQGLGDRAVKERTDAVIKMANVTGEAAKDVSSYMTAIWNNFEDGSKSLEYYADVITKLGAATAASSEEIAGGLEKFAAIGNTIGLSYEYATAMITTIVDKTRQSEDVVGTALKTILARIQGLNLGETLEDGTSLNKYSNALAAVGVQIKDTSGELRSMDSVLNDLGTKWQTLSKDTQIALAQVVGGVRQYNQIIALMDNWSAFELNVDIALGAEGELYKQAEIYAESWEASQKRVQAAMETIYSSLINDEFFIGFNNVLAETLGVIDKVIEGLGGLEGVVSTIGTIMLTLFGDQIAKSLQDLTYNFTSLFKTARDQAAATKQEALELLSTLAGDKGGVGHGALVQAYQSESKALSLMQKQVDNLSETEREIANTLLQQLHVRVDQQAAAARTTDESLEALERQRRLYQNFIGNNNMTGLDPSYTSDFLNVVKGSIAGFEQMMPQMNSLDDVFLRITGSADGAEQQLLDFKNALNNIDLGNLPHDLGEKFVSNFEAIRNAILNSGDINAAKTLWDNYFATLGQNFERYRDMIGTIRNNLQTAINSGQLNPGQMVSYQRFLTLLDSFQGSAIRAGEGLAHLAVSAQDTETALKAFEQYLTKVGVKILSTQDAVVLFARSLSSVGMIVNQIRGLIRLLNDEDANAVDIFTSFAMVLGTSIPTILSLSNSIKMLGQSNAALRLRAQLAAGAITQEAFSAEMATIKTMTLGKAIKSINPWLIIVTGVLSALMIGVPLLIKFLDKKPTGLAESIKRLKKESEQVNQSLQDLQDKVQGIKDDFDKYNTVVEALNTCKEGTIEWYEALKDVKELEVELMANNPELVKFMGAAEVYGYDTSRYYTSDNSAINMTAVLEDYQDYVSNQKRGLEIVNIELLRSLSTLKDYNVSVNKRQQIIKEPLIESLSYDYYHTGNETTLSHAKTGYGLSGQTFSNFENNITVENPTYNASSVLNGLLEYIYVSGLEKGITSYESAVNDYVENNQNVLSHLIGEIDAQEYDNNLFSYIKAVLPETALNAYSSLYVNDWKKVNSNSALPIQALSSGFISSLDLAGYSSEDQSKLTGFLAKYIAESFYEDFIANSIPAAFESGEIEEYIKNILGKPPEDITVAQDEEGFYTFSDGEEEIATGVSPSQIWATSTAAGQVYNQHLGLNEQGTLTYLDEYIKELGNFYDFIASGGNFNLYTLEEINTLKGELDKITSESRVNTILTDMYNGSDYRSLISSSIDVITDTYEDYGNDTKFSGFTIGELETYNSIIESNAQLANIVNKIPEEQLKEFLSLINFDISKGSGLNSFNLILDVFRNLGIEIASTSEEYDNLRKEFTQGSLQLNQYKNLTSEIIQNARALTKGKTLGEKDLNAIIEAGLDINALKSFEGEKYLNQYLSNYASIANQTKQAFEGKSNEEKAIALGFLTASEAEQSIIEQAEIEAKLIDYDLIAQNYAAMGLEYAGFLRGLEDAYYNEYIDQMIRAQAEIDDVDLEDYGKDLSGLDEATYKDWIKQLKFEELIDGYVENVSSGLMESLANDTTLLESERKTLEDFQKTIALILNKDIAEVADLMDKSSEGSGDFWTHLNNLNNSLDADAQKAALKYFGISPDSGDNIIRKIGGAENSILTSMGEAFESGDITNIPYAYREFFKGDDDNSKKRAALQEAGILDENGNLTEEAQKIYNSVDDAYKAIGDQYSKYFDSLTNYVKENQDFFKFENGNENGYLEKLLNVENAINLSTASKNIKKYGGLDAYDVFLDILGKSGDKVYEVVDLFASTNWENITAEELIQSLWALGVPIDGLDSDIDGLVNAMDKAIEFTNSLTKALNNYASNTEIADKLRAGEDITAEEYANMEKVYGVETAQQMFSKNADGTYGLAEGYSGIGVASEIEQSIVKGFVEANTQWQAIKDAKNPLLLEDKGALNTFFGYILENFDTYFKGVDKEKAQQAMSSYVDSAQTKDDLALFYNKFFDKEVPDAEGQFFTEALMAGINRTIKEASEIAKDSSSRISKDNWKTETEGFGLKYEDVEEFAKRLKEMPEYASHTEDSLLAIARAQLRWNRSVEAGEKNLEDWKKQLKTVSKGDLGDFADSLEDVQEAYGDILDIDAKKLSTAFLTNAKSMELYEKAIGGSAEAYNELQALAAQDIYTKSIGNMADEIATTIQAIANLDSVDVGEKVYIGDQGIGDQLNTLYENAYNAAIRGGKDVAEAMGIANNIINSVGYEAPEIEWEAKDVTIVGDLPDGWIPLRNGMIQGPDGNIMEGVDWQKTESGQYSYTQTIMVPKGRSFTKKAEAYGKTSTPRGSRGGGGSRAPRAETKKDTEKERYHTVNNQLEDLTDSYDKVSKAADRAFGGAKVKLIRDQIKAVQDLSATQGKYLKEIEDYYKFDKDNLSQVSAYVGFDVQLDENGTITNFDAIQDAMFSAYNKNINEKGEVIGMDEEAWKAYEQEWERIMALIEQYEETQDLRKEALQQLQDYINEIYDLQLQEISYSVEIDIDVSDYGLEILDYMLKRVEDDAWKAVEAIAILGEQTAEWAKQNETYSKGIRDILMERTKDIYDSNGNKLQDAQLTEADVNAFLNGEDKALEKVKTLNLTDEEVQTLKEYMSNLLKINTTLTELRENVFATVLESFQSFAEELDDTIDKMKVLNEMTNTYRNIIDIVGKKNLGISNGLYASLGQANIEQQMDQVASSRYKAESMRANLDAAKAKLAEYESAGMTAEAELMRKNIKEMEKDTLEAEQNFLSTWENALSAAREQFELEMGIVIDTMSDALAGPLYTSLQQLQEAFDRKNTNAKLHLADYEKIYELNKLNRDIEKSMDETASIQGKQALADLQAEINALEQEGVQISQYQSEDLRRRYELRLAEMALMEAQNAKSEVRMTRDSDGNWNYVYTADSEKVAEAEQNYEDRLYALQQSNAEYIEELQSKLIQAQIEMGEKIAEIRADQTLSVEEQNALIDEVMAHYNEQFNFYTSELELVLDNNRELYETDWKNYSDLTGYKISADENYLDKFTETQLSILTGFKSFDEYKSNYLTSTDTMMKSMSTALDNYIANSKGVFEAAGTAYSGFAIEVGKNVTTIIEHSERLRKDTEEKAEKTQDEFEKILKSIEEWTAKYSALIDSTISKNLDLVNSYKELLEMLGEVNEESPEGEPPVASEENTPKEEPEPQPSEPEEPKKAPSIRSGGRVKASSSAKIYDYAGAQGESQLFASDPKYRVLQIQGDWVQVRHHSLSSGVSGWFKRGDLTAYDTGGYTGAWGPDGRLAMLHEKEIILNKDDSKNFLSAINMVRQVAEIIDLNAYASAGFGNRIAAYGVPNSTGTLEQQVHITAEFPNATDKNEIYEAFNEILNLATQYAGRK